MKILNLSGFYSEHVVLMQYYELQLSMAFMYFIIPLVLGFSSFASLVVEAYASF